MGLPARATVLRIFPSREALEHAVVEAAGDDAFVAEGFITFSGLADLLAGGARLVSPRWIAANTAAPAAERAETPSHDRDDSDEHRGQSGSVEVEGSPLNK